MINWKVRILNKRFWIALIPALLVLIQLILQPFGITIPTEVISGWAQSVINAIFVLLTILGVVNDPTVSGRNDSSQAMTYNKPKNK